MFQSPPQELDTNQALSPPPPGRVGGSIQLDVPASPLPTSVPTPMPSSLMTPNSTTLANSAPDASISVNAFLSTLVATPLPSLPDLTIDTFEGHTAPAPPLKAPLLSVVSKARDTPGLGHSPGPPLAQPLVTAATTAVRAPSPLMTVTVSTPSAAPLPPSLPVPVTGPISHSIPVSPQSPGMIPSSVTSVNVVIDTNCASAAIPPKDLSACTIPISQSPVSASFPSISPACVPQGISVLTPVLSNSLVPPSAHTFQSVHTLTSSVQMCDFPDLFEDVTWLKNHPRPLAVSNIVVLVLVSFFLFVWVWFI